MNEKTDVDVANEPVDVDSAEFMDTGVLHPRKIRGQHVLKIEKEDGRDPVGD